MAKMSSIDKSISSNKKKVGRNLKDTFEIDTKWMTYPQGHEAEGTGGYPRKYSEKTKTTTLAGKSHTYTYSPTGYTKKSVNRVRRGLQQDYKRNLSDQIYNNATNSLRKVATRPIKNK